MNWIKKNYDQFILGLVALLLLGLSAYLIQQALGFQQTFAGIKGEVLKNNHVPAADMSGLDGANSALAKPAAWAPKESEGSLFVSVPYIVQSGTLYNPSEGGMLHPPVPNEWIKSHRLDILDNNVLNEDPDGDGFTNLDEYNGQSDPQDKNSHPPYYTKLRLAQFIKQPFRLLFNAYDGDPNKPESLTFQINTVDLRQPSQFLKLGDDIAGTKFKILKFLFKKENNPNTGEDKDISELTVQNKETGDDVVLVLEKTVDSPDSYALFRYLWNNTQFQVKKNGVFAVPPEPKVIYKVIDIKEDQALIQGPTGDKITVPHLEPH